MEVSWLLRTMERVKREGDVFLFQEVFEVALTRYVW